MTHLNLPKSLIAMMGLLLTLAACTPPTPPPSPTPWSTPTPLQVEATSQVARVLAVTSTVTPAAQPSPTATPPLTALVLWESLPEAQVQALTSDIQVFQTEFPQYAVTLQHYDRPENFMTPLTTGELEFDVVLAAPPLLNNLWAAGQIAPMSDFFPPSFVDGFASVALAGAQQDGELWGLPDTAGFHLLLFYNKDLIDTPPADTTKLSELARSLTTANHWGLGLNSYDPLWLTPWLVPHGGWLTDETGQPTLNTPAMAAALTLYLDWHDDLKGIAPVETYNEVRARFLRGDIAMLIDGEWALAELAPAEELDWGVALLPAVGQIKESQPAAPLALARYWAISRSVRGDRALAVAAFLEHITGPERQLNWTTQFGLLPTRRQALDDPLIANDPALRVSAAQLRAGQVVPLGVNTNAILDAMREPLRGVLDGELTPEEAAELMQRNVGN